MLNLKTFRYALFEQLILFYIIQGFVKNDSKLTRIEHFGVPVLINKATNILYNLSIQPIKFFICALLLLLLNVFIICFSKASFDCGSTLKSYCYVQNNWLYDSPNIFFLVCFQAILLGLTFLDC